MPEPPLRVHLGVNVDPELLKPEAERIAQLAERAKQLSGSRSRIPLLPSDNLGMVAMNASVRARSESAASKHRRRSAAASLRVVNAALKEVDSKTTNRPGFALNLPARKSPMQLTKSTIGPRNPLVEDNLVETAEEAKPAKKSDVEVLELFDDAARFESRSPEEWIDLCNSSIELNADVYHFTDGAWQFTPCWVRGFTDGKYSVELPDGFKKQVRRLRLRFKAEDPVLFEQRLSTARELRASAELEAAFSSLVKSQFTDSFESVPVPAVPVPGGCEAVGRRVLDEAVAQRDWAGSLARAKTRMISSGKVNTEYKHYSSVVWKFLRHQSPPFGYYDGVIFRQVDGLLKRVTLVTAAINVKALKVYHKASQRFHTIESLSLLDVSRGDLTRQSKLLMNAGDAAVMEEQMERVRSGQAACILPSASLDEFITYQEKSRSAVVCCLDSEWRKFIIAEVLDKLASSFDFFTADIIAYQSGPLFKVVKKLEQMMRHDLLEVVKISASTWSEFLMSFLSPRVHDPLLKLQVIGTDESISISPSQDDLVAGLSKLLTDLPEALSPLQTCDKAMLPFLKDLESTPLLDKSTTYPEIEDAKSVTRIVISEAFTAPMEILSKLKPFEKYLTMTIPVLNPLDLETSLATVAELKTALDSVKIAVAPVEKAQLFEVISTPAVAAVTAKISSLLQGCLEQIKLSALTRLAKLAESWDQSVQQVRAVSKDENDLARLKEYITFYPAKVVNPYSEILAHIKAQISLLEEFNCTGLSSLLEDAYELGHWPATIKAEVSSRFRGIEEERLRFIQKLTDDKARFEVDLKRWQSDLAFVKFQMTDFTKSAEYSMKINTFNDQLNEAIKRVQDFNRKEDIFSVELTDKTPVEDLILDYAPYYKMWVLCSDYRFAEDDWMNGPICNLKPNDIAAQLDITYKAAFKMIKAFESNDIQKRVLEDCLAGIKAFREFIPAIDALSHESMQQRHWMELFDAMDVEPENDVRDISLANLLDLGVMKYIEKVFDISQSAQKDYKLRKTLSDMKKEWKTIVFELIAYKETGTFVVKGVDDIQNTLDDHIIKTQAIRSSPYAKMFEKEARDWEGKLSFIQEAIDLLLACQRNWLYLEPIFSSEDIVRQMPGEAKRFFGVDQLWRATMTSLADSASVLDFTEIDNLLPSFQEAVKRLDEIQKGLNDYLETKRLYFPRFFFLSNDELLSIVSETKDPLRVQPHLNKCFEGIAKVKFDRANEVIQCLLSSEGEVVQLEKQINVNATESKGCVEKWLLKLESSMVDSLRSLLSKSVASYATAPRVSWVTEWPGQIVLATDMIYWTRETTQALQDQKMETYLGKVNDQLKSIVNLVRGELTPLVRRTLAALTTIDVHNRDVVASMYANKVMDAESFDWLAQLRYYLCEAGSITSRETGEPTERLECQVKIVNSCLLYAFEYLGNSDRLVITPLTDRCYRTLMGAFHLYYGGAPEGPAGTGKTESVKDLAKAMAVQCVVFNCSDGMDYLSMGKFFKGLASSGAWCCFDEFNRINVEVLSVIAQQVLTIQMAVRDHKEHFFFEGIEIKLNPSCAVNITMNPGYAGRAELPDNLKALFRPCAMMVPDYALIGEIFLYSYGFENARDLGRKAVQALRLSSEQLSSQDHYDFGMRGLKSILVAAGALKRKYGDTLPESTLGLRAFLDVNVPKFTANDIPLFRGIVGDLFPGVSLPPVDGGAFTSALTQATIDSGLQVTENHMRKAEQLWETMLVRHGLMTVGAAPCGKTAVCNVLSLALDRLATANPTEYANVVKYVINPKSITQAQLYGNFDDNTHEWTDGILAIAVRNASRATDQKRQWIILDGPVDAVWVENMNSVLDDNKKLCLLSGEIIKLSPLTTMMFEVADLAVASPATVSRCGMVFMEPQNLGWRPIVKSYVENRFPKNLVSKRSLITSLFETHIDISLEVSRKCSASLATTGNWLALSCARLFRAMLIQHFPYDDSATEGATAPLPKDADNRIDILFHFSLLWTIGGSLDQGGRSKFEPLVRDLIMADPRLIDKWSVVTVSQWKSLPVRQALPDGVNLFDCYVAEDTGKWTPWVQRIKSLDIPANAQYHQIIVPTADTVRNQYLMERYIDAEVHVLFCGLTGTGKTISVQSKLQKGLDKEKFTALCFGFSAQTSANQTQDIIDGKLDKRRKGVFGPPLGKRMLIFVDDLSMPAKEVYGAQPPIELLRQFMCQDGWYDRKTAEFRKLQDIQFLAAMSPPGGGRNDVTARYTWHYNLLYVPPYHLDSLTRIFQTVMKWYMSANSFLGGVSQIVGSVVNATVDIYRKVSEELLPTPAKSHYTFNLRDISKVFQGLCSTKPDCLPAADDLIKCWAHEMQRVFQDRLVTSEDRDWFSQIIKVKMEEYFKRKWATLVPLEPLIFTDVMNAKGLYQEVTDHDALIAKVKDVLADYNQESKLRMNLVLFMTFVEHVARVIRVIRLPLGNLLAVGIGGSGRRSVARLACYVADYELFKIEISKAYGLKDWCDDLKRMLIRAGAQDVKTTFVFSDTQVQKESFLEDISNILNIGEVPNLFNSDDKAQIIEMCTRAARSEGATTPAEIMGWFTENCRKNLHVALCLSPIGESFRQRLRNYPSLVNCCTIDWFMEWPRDALTAVAREFLTASSIADDLDPKTIDGVVNVCVEMQTSAYQLTERYRVEAQRNFYITPTSYLELVGSFLGLLGDKRKQVSTMKSRYDTGISKLVSTSEQVKVMQKELEDLQPVLKRTAAENAELMKVIVVRKQEASVVQQNVSKEEAEANAQADLAKSIQAECAKDLSAAMPALEAALDALSRLSKADVVEVKAMNNPPTGVVLVATALCIMFDVAPKKEKSPDGKTKIDNFWEPAKKYLFGDSNILKKLVDYDKDHIAPEIMRKMQPFETDPNFEPDIIRKASAAAYGICKWCRAMIVYDRVAKEVAPKRARLEDAKKALATATRNLAEKKEELRLVQEKLQRLEDDFASSQRKQDDLAKQVEECRLKLTRADKLVGGLGGEKTRWQQASKDLAASFINVTGDILLSSGFIAYIGPFTAKYRKDIVEQWSAALRKEGIPTADTFHLTDAVGDAVKIRQWVIEELPNDFISIDNAIILDKSRRWPLMIDPQLQANKWVKNMHGDKLKVLRLSQSDYSRTLENAIQFGMPVLIEGLLETIDPLLEPLLSKAFTKAGNVNMIRLGDATIEYNEDFRLYLTSKLPNPHYAPEVCVSVTLLNFSTTFDGLSDQLLSILVAIEEPDKEKRRQDLVIESASSKAQLKSIEDRILELLSLSKGNILDDEELIKTLSNSKVASQRIEERMVIQERAAVEIQETRDWYAPVAARAASLFFVVTDLSQVESTYQYSLEWFVGIYLAALASAEKARGEVRLKNLNEEFIRRLYLVVCGSLFEKHKLLFAFLLATKMLDFDVELNQSQLRLLLTGGGGSEPFTQPKPTGQEWISDVMWSRCCQLGVNGGVFEGFPSLFENHITEWKNVFDHENPTEAHLPGLNAKLTGLELALVMQAIRPDGLVRAVQKMVASKLGAQFLEPPPFDLEGCYQVSKPELPLVFVLTAGADPMAELLKVAEKLDMKEKIKLISLGQGQGPKATRIISDSAKEGNWVVLQNCHLATSYMAQLEGIIENMNPSELHAQFRLWLTTMPSPVFPVSILQNGIKITVEPAKGLKQNLLRAYLAMDETWLESSSKPQVFKSLLFGLSFFHALVLERRKFGALGWNIQYQFSDADRQISASQLHMFLEDFKEVPYKALNYMVAEANYGGRVTDANDRNTIIAILKDFYTVDILNEGYKFSPSGVYYAPAPTTRDGYIDYIRKLPINEATEVFSLHSNADLTALISEGTYLLSTAVSLLPRSGAAKGKSPFAVFGEIAESIEAKMPKEAFDIEAITRRFPAQYDESMNTVLVQELMRFNKLVNSIRSSLRDLQRAVKGQILMTQELQNVGASLTEGKVPDLWKAVSYPSLKPVGAYVTDLIKRLQFMNHWVDAGKPPTVYWISGFFFTQGFMTGILQNFSRKFKHPIDTCIWNYQVQPRTMTDPDSAPDRGAFVTGVFMDGARWDGLANVIAESIPKQLYDAMPIIKLVPVEQSEDKTPEKHYACPLYKTSDRRGVLMTTGHSTNFVAPIILPIAAEHDSRFWTKRGVALLTQLDS